MNVVSMKCMDMILKLSPIGVFCLLVPVIANNGSKVLGSLAMVLLCAYVCYLVHMFLVYSTTVRTMGGMSPLKFFKGQMPAMIFAFSSASSVGTLPINMDGSEGPRAEKCRQFKALLEEVCGLPVVLWDERRSSIEAHAILHAAGKKEKKHRKTVDAVAASLILEGYLGSAR